MTDLSLIFISSFIIAFSGAIMPGPLLTAAISGSLQRGYIAGPLLIAGHGIAELLLLTALLLGLAPILQGDKVFAIIAASGGIILIIMAVGMLKSNPTINLTADGKTQSNIKLVMGGAILSIVNPYWIIWWATIGLGYILHSWNYGLLGFSVFFCAHLLADFTWYTAITVAIGKGRNFITGKFYRALLNTCAVFLFFFAFYFFYEGFRRIEIYLIS